MASSAMLVAAGCGGADPGVPEIDRPADISIEVAVADLVGPTQIFVEPDGSVVAAVINGEENGGTGQVIRIDGATGERTVLFDGLDKPTGVQRDGDTIYVMEADRLSAGAADVGGPLTVLADDLPNNGRSEGTITLHPDGGILFNTSGSARGLEVREGSGEIRMFAPPAGESSETVASGFKHAYAMTFAADGSELWTTEVADGSFDGVRAVDEVVLVTPPASGGWPRCVGDNRAVEEFGVDQAECDGFRGSRAVFPAGATPTSIVVSPFHEDSFLVALWLTGEVVVVPRQGSDPTDWQVFATGLKNPQHLTVDDDAVYLSEFGANRILKLTQTNSN